MSISSLSRHCWSWRNCFATVKHNKKKNKTPHNYQSNKKKTPSNDKTHNKHLQTVDENSNILCDFDSSSDECHQNLILNDYKINNEHENNFINNDSIQRTVDDINSKVINQKSSSIIKPTSLDAIVEDSNEENSDELDETIQPVRLYCDRELINDSNTLYSHLFDLSKMNHFIIQFNDNGYFLGEFTRHLGKLKSKIDDIKRTSTEIPRDAELLEAKYSTLLATIESLSLLLKVAQILSSRSSMNRLIFSIEQRMEQLNKLVRLSSSIAMSQKQEDLIDEDFLSFRSALSSYEHLLTLSS